MQERRRPLVSPPPQAAAATGPSSPTPEDDPARLILDSVRLLHVNGAETERVEERTRHLGAALGVPAAAELGWSQSSIVLTRSDRRPADVRPFAAPPSDLGLNRVLAVDEVANRLVRGRLRPDGARTALRQAADLPPANLPLFALACAVGGCALAVILGARHPGTLAIIAVTASVGALARRHLGRLGANNYWQVGAAGMLAGLGGAISAALGLSSPLGLAAVCPCMVLVPGPHLLKGALDIGSLRITLGIARLTFAIITLAATASGLLIGLWVGRADLVADPPGRLVPLWVDVPAAGVVAVCYGIFYSSPLRILGWPFVVGMAAHALRWVTLEIWHTQSWVGAGLACLLVGAVLCPVASRRNIPFSAIGFASVVSLMPGVFVFRALGGLAQLQTATADRAQTLVLDTVNNGNAAILTVLAMAVGFLVPAALWRRVLATRPSLSDVAA